MMLEGILPFARTLLKKVVKAGDIAVDATAGNGHDTLFLAKLTGDTGHVFSFDIQKDAIENTKKRLAEHGIKEQVTLIHQGHENIFTSIPEPFHDKITGAVFNLGYLPGGDKSIVTKSETTIPAIEQLIEILAPGGLIVLIIYHGHPEGKKEKDKLLSYVMGIDQQQFHVLRYGFINQKNEPPFIVAIEKR